MEPIDYLRGIKRRWLLIAFAVVIGAVAGYLTAPGSSKKATTFKADVILVTPTASGAGSGGGGAVNFDQIDLLVTNGAVPRDAAAQLGIPDPTDAVKNVTANGDAKKQAVTITARANTKEQAARTADAFSNALLANLAATATAQHQAELQAAQESADKAQADLNDLNNSVHDPRDTSFIAQQSGAQAKLDQANLDLQKLQQQPAPTAPLVALDQAHGEIDNSGGLKAPNSKSKRALLLALVGLIIGIAAALVADRLDARIHTKAAAEEAFGIPLLGEIPPMPGRRTNPRQLLAATKPESAFVEAYRSLRTVILLEAEGMLEEIHMGAQGPPSDKRVILITSPGGGEGKTTTVANLAVLMAETGRKVLVVSADFRRPKVHEMFDRPVGPGLTEVLSGQPDAPKLSELELNTGIPGVYVLPSGTATTNPSALLPEVEGIIRSARELFDIVLVDTAPLLVANDAAELMPAADAVIVLGRDGRTTFEAASRSIELLRRIDAPVIGSVLIGTEDTPTAYLYYRYRYYGYGEKSRRGRRRKNGYYHSNGTSDATVDDQPVASTEPVEQ